MTSLIVWYHAMTSLIVWYHPPVQAKIFADDTKLYVAHSSDSISPLSLLLSNFCIWSQSWQLNIAFQKCSVIYFGHNSANNSYSLGGVFCAT